MDDRERLIQLLTALIIEGVISEEEADSIIDAFDRGEGLPEGWQLPLSILDALPADLRDRVTDALEFYVGIASANVDAAQDEFIKQSTSLARQLSNGGLSVSDWHDLMVILIIDYLAQQAQVGAQRQIAQDELEDLTGLVLIQLVFLSRFADAVASNRQTPAQVESRVQLYAGEGRAIYFQQSGITNALYGYVEDYIALDDRNTCGPCATAEAQGPYLPGLGPMPGRVCLGRGYCRCQRQLRYDPAAYLRLGGRSA